MRPLQDSAHQGVNFIWWLSARTLQQNPRKNLICPLLAHLNLVFQSLQSRLETGETSSVCPRASTQPFNILLPLTPSVRQCQMESRCNHIFSVLVSGTLLYISVCQQILSMVCWTHEKLAHHQYGCHRGQHPKPHKEPSFSSALSS